jgi:predicted DNA-binding protein (UPF0251 family)
MENRQKNNAGRPQKCRFVKNSPKVTYYKPRGIPMSDLNLVILTVDEMEAIRLADYEGLYHQEACKKMRISRQTFSRILSTAHKKIGDGIINGKAIEIKGGNFNIKS